MGQQRLVSIMKMVRGNLQNYLNILFLPIEEIIISLANLNLDLSLIFGQVAIFIVTMMTWPLLGGEYCSMILRVLQCTQGQRFDFSTNLYALENVHVVQI